MLRLSFGNVLEVTFQPIIAQKGASRQLECRWTYIALGKTEARNRRGPTLYLGAGGIPDQASRAPGLSGTFFDQMVFIPGLFRGLFRNWVELVNM